MKTSDLNKNSKTSLNQGSKSFSFASRFFSKRIQDDVSHLYSWCRWCDDITDGSNFGFHQNPAGLPVNRVEVLIKKSHLALLGHDQDLELPFVAFGQVMRKYQIPWTYAEDLLKGMQHDVSGKTIKTLEDLLLYCYRVAGTVGLMMCHIMGLKNSKALEKAVHLGIALQLTNILRDIGDDFRVSKVYLPETWLSEFKVPSEDLMNSNYSLQLESIGMKLLKVADTYYKSGLTGLLDLSWQCALAVAIAASVYRKIGEEVVHKGHLSWKQSSSRLEQTRVSIGHWSRIQACCSGIWLFMKTMPERVIHPRPTVPIDQIWRYS